jgi:hypothetical protein
MRKIASKNPPQRFLDMFSTFMFLDDEALRGGNTSKDYIKSILSITPNSERDNLLKESTGLSISEVREMLRSGVLSRTAWENSVKESLQRFN